MLDTIKNYISEYTLEILVFISVIAIIIIFFKFRKQRKKKYYIDIDDLLGIPKYKSTTKKFKRIKESKGERKCRDVLEKIFNKPFKKVRPAFLNNDITGEELELDAYNEDLKLAVEYQGRQHTQFTPFFHKNHETFRNQQYRDYMKRQKCQENGIILIEVPYTVKIDDIEDYLVLQIDKYRDVN
jgi:hypothetical protein